MLKFENVTLSYHKETIIRDLSLNIEKGLITTIIGPNGCGKTTLLSSLNGGSDVTAGSISLDGTNLKDMPPKQRARRIAYLPQVRSIIPALPARTLVEHGRFPYLGFARKKSSRDVELVNQAMEFTDTAQYASQYADTLSGGIRQRVFFAMVLAQDCDLLVLDEPTTYLDISGQRMFYEMLDSLRSQGKTILLVLHDISRALSLSDRIVVMDHGTICYHGDCDGCVDSHVIENAFNCRCRRMEDEEGCYYVFV